MKLADMPTGLVGGGHGRKSPVPDRLNYQDQVHLTAPWRFDPFSYSKLSLG